MKCADYHEGEGKYFHFSEMRERLSMNLKLSTQTLTDENSAYLVTKTKE